MDEWLVDQVASERRRDFMREAERQRLVNQAEHACRKPRPWKRMARWVALQRVLRLGEAHQ